MRMDVLPALLVVLAAAAPVSAVDLPAPASAELCGDCHRAIQEGWRESAHASAMTSRLFQDALKMAEADRGTTVRKLCLECHAPLAVRLHDLDLVRKVSWEGVTCDYCHSIRGVAKSGANLAARVEISGLKSGPSEDSVSPSHQTAYSEVHTRSLACAVCHEYVNGQGFPVLTTYSEWQASDHDEAGTQCQSCHMFLVQGNVVDPRVRRQAVHEVNLHQMPGSHSIQQLNQAVSMQLATDRKGDAVHVQVKISNVGAGHSVPTGSPMRRLILKVRAESYAGQRFSEERVYVRNVADRDGKPIVREHDAFLRAAEVVSDNRIAAGETRVEHFSFPLAAGRPARVVANLYYYYSPAEEGVEEEKVSFLELSRLVR